MSTRPAIGLRTTSSSRSCVEQFELRFRDSPAAARYSRSLAERRYSSTGFSSRMSRLVFVARAASSCRRTVSISPWTRFSSSSSVRIAEFHERLARGHVGARRDEHFIHQPAARCKHLAPDCRLQRAGCFDREIGWNQHERRDCQQPPRWQLPSSGPGAPAICRFASASGRNNHRKRQSIHFECVVKRCAGDLGNF